jgi:acyltransferase
MFDNKYGNVLLIYVAAFSGIICLIRISKLLFRFKIIEYVGRNTIIILAFHQFPIFSILAKVFSYVEIFNTNNQFVILLKGGSYTVFCLIILTPIIYIINNYLPFIIGKTTIKTRKCMN